MWLENHPKGSLFLIIVGTLIIGNLLFLNIVYFSKQQSQKSAISPQDSTVLPPSSAKPNLDDYLKLCRQEIDQVVATIAGSLKSRLTTTEGKKTQPEPASTTKTPSITYWPLGGSIVTNKQEWSYPGGSEAFFNKNDYAGAKKITWEAFLKIKDSNGEANARLYDASHKVVISNSEIKGGGETLVLRPSAPLLLLEGNNLYQVQLRSTTGYEVYLEGARFKIEY
jgi:hypothetical protein